VVDDDKPCDEYNAAFAKTLALIEKKGFEYNFLGENSNSVAWTLLRKARIAAPTRIGKLDPASKMPGWGNTLIP
jgi:hypothetical protein